MSLQEKNERENLTELFVTAHLRSSPSPLYRQKYILNLFYFKGKKPSFDNVINVMVYTYFSFEFQFFWLAMPSTIN